jgi:hypothetical protein
MGWSNRKNRWASRLPLSVGFIWRAARPRTFVGRPVPLLISDFYQRPQFFLGFTGFGCRVVVCVLGSLSGFSVLFVEVSFWKICLLTTLLAL